MEVWMVSGVFVVLLAAFSLCGAVFELFAPFFPGAVRLAGWATSAAVLAAALAIVTYVLYALVA